jgi:hypothetical protein
MISELELVSVCLPFLSHLASCCALQSYSIEGAARKPVVEMRLHRETDDSQKTGLVQYGQHRSYQPRWHPSHLPRHAP